MSVIEPMVGKEARQTCKTSENCIRAVKVQHKNKDLKPRRIYVSQHYKQSIH